MPRRAASQFALIVGGFLLALGLQALAFTEPSSAPPAGNVSAPINTGAISQDKSDSTGHAAWITADGLGSRYGALFATISGDVGIGTTSPVSQLSVYTTTANPSIPGDQVLIQGVGNGGGYLRLQGDYPLLRFGSNLATSGSKNFQIQNNGSGVLTFGSNNDDWSWKNAILALTTGGSVGVGTMSPAWPLTVSSSATNDATRLGIINTGTGGRSWNLGVFGNEGSGEAGGFGIADMTAGQWRLFINSSGAVGIGTINPATTYLHVGGGSPTQNDYAFISSNPNGYSLEVSNLWASNYLNAASYLINGGCWAGNCASDIRVKDDVRPFTLGLDALKNIDPVYYRYNGLGGMPKSTQDNIGVIAQDVEKSAPEIVSTKEVQLHPSDTASTTIEQVNYSALPFIAINAIKDLYSRWMGDSQDLHAKLDAQQKEIDQLKAIVCQDHPNAAVCVN